MKRIISAIEKGRCVVAVASSLLRDAQVMLALTERASLPAVALSGPAVAPVMPIKPDAVVRAVAEQGGVVVLVDPQSVDLQGVAQLMDLLRGGPNKPAIKIVSKAYNPFAFGGALSGFDVSHVKSRGQAFFRDLPMPPSESAAPTPDVAVQTPARRRASDAPRLAFVGRDEELAAMKEALGEGGPILVTGPPGIGKTWLTVHALAEAGVEAYPDLVLGYGVGADAFVARLAMIAKEGGSDLLADLLAKKERTPVEVAKLAVEALQAASGNEGRAFVVHNFDYALGRQADFFRKSRLELILEALLSARYPLRLVLLSAVAPAFYRTAIKQNVRHVPLAGVGGKFLHEIFEAYKAPEFERAKFGPIHDRIHGHPLAARTFAVAMSERKDGEELPDSPKFMKMADITDIKVISKQLRNRVDKVKGPLRGALSLVAHFIHPMPGKLLSDAGLFRKHRSELLSLGLLDVVGTETSDKRYRVHPLVREHLGFREITDFDVLRDLARRSGELSRKAEGDVERLAWAQVANRCAELGRDRRGRVEPGLPDDDAFLDSIGGILRRKDPRFDLVEQQSRQIIKREPSNADAHILLIESLLRSGAKNEDITAAIDDALAKAVVPEIFHLAATFYLQRRARLKALQILERGVAMMPDESRLATRFASLLLRQGRRPEAMKLLQHAMDIEPELPDAYGLMGMARRDEGMEALESAEQLLREAVRLAPTDAVQVSRLAGLLLDKARIAEFDERDALRQEARELLDPVVKSNQRAAECALQLASLVREEGGEDLERVEWLLKRASKATERGSERRFRIRLERALYSLAKGELDHAEKEIRELAERDPSNHRVFFALAQVLMARGLYIPAHAEYMRARERTPAGSIARLEYETEVVRLQALIEAQAAGLTPQTPVAAEEEAEAHTPELHSASAHRVIRRRTGGDDEEKAEEPQVDDKAETPDAEPEAPQDEAETEAPEAETEAPAEAPEVEAPEAETPESEDEPEADEPEPEDEKKAEDAAPTE